MSELDDADVMADAVRPLRIVHVMTRMLRAGSEENTVASCLHQIGQGHEVYLLHGDAFDADYAEELEPSIRRVRVDELVHPIRPLSDVRAVRALRRRYRELRPDVIHTHQSKAGVIGRLAADPERHAIVHTVHIAHFLNVGWLRERLFVALEKLCAARSHAIVSVSEGVMQACLERRIGLPEQHRVIHSGMDVTRFSGAANAVERARRVERRTDMRAPFVVLMVAAFEPRKRHERFIETMAPVLRRRPGIRLVLCGQGARLQASRELAERLGVAGQVQFAGHVTDVEDRIASAALCVLTSEREGLPRVLVQYAAARQPMVVNHLPGIEAIARHGANAAVFADDDVGAVAAEAERLYLDRDALHAMRRAAASIDVSSWSVERMGRELQDVYARALASVRPATGHVPRDLAPRS